MTATFLEEDENEKSVIQIDRNTLPVSSRKPKKASKMEDEIYEDEYYPTGQKKTKISDDELCFSDGYDDDLMGDSADRER